MTVPAGTRRMPPYVGNDVTTDLPFTFYVPTSDALAVIQVEAATDIQAVLVLDTDYTIEGLGVEAGGTVILSDPIATGYSVYLIGDTPITQPTDFKNQSTYQGNRVERAFDREVIQIQELENKALVATDLVTLAYDAQGRDIEDIGAAYVDELYINGVLVVPEDMAFSLPDPAGNALELLRVNVGGTAYETKSIAELDLATKANAVIRAPTVADMKALTGLVDGARIETSCRTIAGKGAATYLYNASNVATPTEFFVVAPDTLPGNFELIEDAPTVDQAGGLRDGVTSDQAAIERAVADCLARSLPLNWLGGSSYVSTANIPDFHSVRHYGQGSILRGSTTFRIEPLSTQTNSLYVATTGVDTNDGISSTAPFLTNQKAFNILKERGVANQTGVLRGRWVVNVAAGTYTEFVTHDSATQSEFPVDWTGPVAGHPNVPTAIINGTGNETQSGISAAVQSWVRITDILFQDFSAGNACENTGSNMSLANVHTFNCRTSLANLHTGFASVRGGIWDGNGIADSIGYNSFYCATHDFVQATNDAATDALVIKNFVRGALINEGVQGHFDNVNITDCTGSALNIKRGAGAINTKTMKIHRNAVGVLAENTGWFNNGIDFGSGADVNTVNVRQLGGGGELDFLCQQNSARTSRLIVATNISALTGVTTEQTRWTSPAIDDWCISEAGHVGKVRIGGSCPALAGTATLRFYLNDGTDDGICTAVIPAGVTEFVAEWQCYYSASNSQRGFLYVIRDGGNPLVDIQIGNRSLKNVAHTVKVTLQLSNAADSVTLDQLTFEGTYGG